MSTAESRISKFFSYNVLIFIFVGLPFLALLWWNIDVFIGPTRVKIGDKDCLHTTAHVIEKHETSHRSTQSSGTLLMSYKYKVGSEVFTSKEEVEYNLYHRYDQGDTCTIYYMKENPGRSLLMGNDISTDNRMKAVLLDSVIIGFILYALFKKKKAKRDPTIGGRAPR